MPEPADGLADAYLLLFDSLREKAAAAGHPIEDYKPTDRACLRIVFSWLLNHDETGFEFAVDLVHELVWAQCLANGNHRTAFVFLEGLLEAAG